MKCHVCGERESNWTFDLCVPCVNILEGYKYQDSNPLPNFSHDTPYGMKECLAKNYEIWDDMH